MVVEDDDAVAAMVKSALASEGMDVELTADPADVLARLADGEDDWDVLILDVGLPGISGIDVLRRFRAAGSLCTTVMLTGDATARTATTCMSAGAFYYLTKPFKPFELRALITSAAQFSRLARALVRARDGETGAGSTLVGTSVAMRQLRDIIRRVGERDVPILIHGESGTGKELVARALHESGSRRTRRFVALNCAAIPEALIDSELFGHTRGAFTGATGDRAGVFVDAHGGTLFLDEIADMPMQVQARLLRVLQEREIRPVGGSTTRPIDVRVIAASHVDLADAVAKQRFREDLFYRLNVVRIEVPPLRERLDDLPLLVAHFLCKHAGDSAPKISSEAFQMLADHRWPGNIRELENALLSALAMSGGPELDPAALPAHIGSRPRRESVAVEVTERDDVPLAELRRRTTENVERRYLTRIMEKARGSVSEAARLASVDRTNFRRLLQRHGLDARTFKR